MVRCIHPVHGGDMKHKRTSVFSVVLCVSLHLFVVPVHAANPAAPSASGQETAQKNTDSVSAQSSMQKDKTSPAFTTWLHLLDHNENNERENSSVLAFAPKVPADLARVLTSIGGEQGAKGVLHAFLLVIISLALGRLIVFGAKRFAVKGIARLQQVSPPTGDSLSSLWAGLARSIPRFSGVVLFTMSSTLIFLVLAEDLTAGGRMLFQYVLGFILIQQIGSLLSQIIFAPNDNMTRPFAMNDTVAKSLYRATLISIVVILAGRMTGRFIHDLGAIEQTLTWVAIVIGTAVIAILAGLVMYLKVPVSASLQADSKERENSWIREQIISYWHVPALLYLFFAWFIWLSQEFSGTNTRNGSFIISLFIIPLYLIISYFGRTVIRSIIDSLGIGTTIIPDNGKPAGQDEVSARELALCRKKDIEAKAYLIFRIVLACAMATWTLTLWGYDIPFAQNAMRAIFESLITLALALLVWRIASTYIARKIEESTPEPVKSDEDDDNEFGGAAPASRSHTLLPLLRKVLASTLIVMVSLTILSSLGVNIAPILAGAGVLGLAVGFGAQKLVSDVLSGFFFLLDDAFRVGEYIEAGSIKGAVQAITLRNVILRHTRGMIQIVPHSDLGAITNFMRGGIIVKFPLEFPYDTNIEKVRKIIKKVGQAMLQDEELSNDFILPLKSQGVNEITNSVMIIRVKFTAKPGKQFTIKREAFRRITEALAASGIHYAHRKVIVDFPEDMHKGVIDEQTRRKALEAGAAAAIAAEAEQQQQQQALAENKV